MHLGVTAHYESTMVPHFPAHMEKEVYHEVNFFQEIKTNSSIIHIHTNIIFSYFFHGKLSKVVDKNLCPLNKGQ